MITIYDVIKRPHMAEKNEILQTEKHNVVVFKVHPDAGKPEIKEAVERFFKVKVADVRTMNYKGKEKRYGRTIGRRKDWKKAIVVLKEGEKLDFV